jgi:hypothetical protein
MEYNPNVTKAKAARPATTNFAVDLKEFIRVDSPSSEEIGNNASDSDILSQ